MPLVIPAQQEVARETSTPLFPRNWASHLLRGGMLGSQNGKKRPKWQWPEDKERKKLVKMEKKEICRRVRTSGETNTSPSQLAQFAQGSLGGRRQMYKRRKPRRIDPSPLGLAHPHTLRVYYPLLFLIKLSCNQAITLVCHFNIQIFAVVRQNQEKYTLPRHIYLYLHLSISEVNVL